MKDKNPIDNIFKQGLDGKGLPYSEKHWNEMEKILIAKEKPFLFRYKWYLITLLLSCSIIFYFLLENKLSNDSITQSNQQGISIQETNTKPLEDQEPLDRSNEISPDQTSPSNPAKMVEANDEAQSGKLKSKAKTASNVILASSKLTDAAAKLNNNISSSTASDHGIMVEEDTGNFETIEALNPRLSPKHSFQFAIGNNDIGRLHLKTKLETHSKLKYYVQPFFGISILNKDYKLDENNSLKAYEVPEIGTDFGINVRIEKRRWSLVSGVISQQFNETTNYKSEVKNYEFDTTLVLANRSFVQRPDGSYAALITHQVDTTTTITDTVVCPECHTQFSYITIPLQIQYEHRMGPISVFTQAGLSYSYLRRVNGLYSVGPSAKDISSNSLDHMNRNILQMRAALGVKFHITPSMSLNSSFGYSVSNKSMIKDYEQRFKIQQFRLGLEWELGNSM